MKFAFVTCVQIGLSCMEAIYEIEGKLDLIISIPDNKAKNKSGRIYIDEFANKHKIPIIKTNHINDKVAKDAIKNYKIDWLFIIGWSQIASKDILKAPKYGVIGAHPTLLPQGRGRAAIPWAIIKGLNKTGVSFFQLDEGVDTGLILDQEEIPIKIDETATSLYEKVNLAHEVIIKRLYKKISNDIVKGEKQDESKATLWEGRKPSDGEFNNSMSMIEVDRLVRATTKPYPGAFLKIGNKKIIIWKGFASKNKMQDNNLFFEIKLKDGFYYGENYEICDISEKAII